MFSFHTSHFLVNQIMLASWMGTHHAENRAFFRSARLCQSTLQLAPPCKDGWSEATRGTVNLKARGPPKLSAKGTLKGSFGHSEPNLSNISGPESWAGCDSGLYFLSLSASQWCPKASATRPKTASCKWPFQGCTRTESSLRSHIPRCQRRPQWWSRRRRPKPLQHTTSHPGLAHEKMEKNGTCGQSPGAFHSLYLLGGSDYRLKPAYRLAKNGIHSSCISKLPYSA